MSSNDEFVALGSATEVLIYRIDSRQVSRYMLSQIPNPKLDSQRVCFSAGSKKFLVATRNTEGNVRIYVSECMGDTLNPDLALLKMPTVGRFFSLPNHILLLSVTDPFLSGLTSLARASITISGCLRPFMTTPLAAHT